MPRVLNKRFDTIPPDAVCVDRSTKWGNPFSHMTGPTRAVFHVRTREESIEAHNNWFLNSDNAQSLRDALDELTGHDLVCWCKPLLCHADLLLELANN